MKKIAIQLISLSLVASLLASCTSTYDAYGRPTQSVDPVLATAGIAAAGLIGYQASKNRYKSGYKNNRYSNPRPVNYGRYSTPNYGNQNYGRYNQGYGAYAPQPRHYH